MLADFSEERGCVSTRAMQVLPQTFAKVLQAKLTQPAARRGSFVVMIALLLHVLALHLLSHALHPRRAARLPAFMLTRIVMPVAPSAQMPAADAPSRPAVQRQAPVPSWMLAVADTSLRTPIQPVDSSGPDRLKPAAASLRPVAGEEMTAQSQTVDEDVTLPSGSASHLNNPQPVMPSVNGTPGRSGRVVVRVLVGADGHPQQVRMVRSSGWHQLDHVALETVRHWRFEPGRRRGLPETMWLTLPVDFTGG